MKQKITIISSLPPVVGLSPYTKELVLGLSKYVKIHFLGFHHIYPSFLYPGKLYDESTEPLSENNDLVIRNTLNWFNPFGWFYEAFKINTDIVHAQWWSYPLAPIYWTILGISKLRKKKIILTVHNVLPHEKSLLKILLNKSVFGLGDEFIVHTTKNKQDLQKFVKNKPIHVLPHGIITSPLKGISKREARLMFNIAEEDKILLCFGHIRDYKGLDTALRSLSQIKDPSVKLLIAGKCWEDWSKYKTIIENCNLEKRVILKLGFIAADEIEPIFRASDLVLLPYRYFNAQSGLGALALPYGIPMIVSNTGGLTDYVSDDHCIIEPEDHNALAKSILNILSNPTLYAKLKDNTRYKLKEHDWDMIAEQTTHIY